MSAQGKQPPKSPRRWWVWLVAPLGVIVADALVRPHLERMALNGP